MKLPSQSKKNRFVSRDHEEAEDVKGDVFAMYCAEDDPGMEQPPVFNSTLGLAIETLRHGVTIEDLWRVV